MYQYVEFSLYLFKIIYFNQLTVSVFFFLNLSTMFLPISFQPIKVLSGETCSIKQCLQKLEKSQRNSKMQIIFSCIRNCVAIFLFMSLPKLYIKMHGVGRRGLPTRTFKMTYNTLGTYSLPLQFLLYYFSVPSKPSYIEELNFFSRIYANLNLLVN